MHVRDLIDISARRRALGEHHGRGRIRPHGLGTPLQYFYAARERDERPGGVRMYSTGEYQHGRLETSGKPWEGLPRLGLSFGWLRPGAPIPQWHAVPVDVMLAASDSAVNSHGAIPRSGSVRTSGLGAWNDTDRSCAACVRCRPGLRGRHRAIRGRRLGHLSFTGDHVAVVSVTQVSGLPETDSTTRVPRFSRWARRARGMGRA